MSWWWMLLAARRCGGASMRWKANEISYSFVDRGLRVSAAARSIASGQVAVLLLGNMSTCVSLLTSSISHRTNDGFFVDGATSFVSDVECDDPIVTSGLWNDANQWEEGIVPGEGDDAYLDAEFSTAILDSDVTVRHVFLSAGTISLSSDTECSDGWMPTPSRRSCISVFSPASWKEAQCPSPSHLAHLGSEESNRILGLVCDMCWIGIKGDEWVESGAFFDGDQRFRRWRNAFSEEQCGAIDNRLRWLPNDCDTILPFACSMRGDTTAFELKVARFFWSGGSVSGAGNLVSSLVRVNSECFLEKAATLTVESEMVVEAGASVVARNIGYVVAIGTLGVTMEAGSAFATDRGSASLTISSESMLEITGNAVVDWRVNISPGAEVIVDGGSLALSGGGVAAGAVFNLKNSLLISNRSLELRGPTIDYLTLSSDAFVVREDVEYHPDSRFGTARFVQNRNDESYYQLDAAQDNGPTLQKPVGVYALELVDGTKTACLGWQASARAVKRALEDVIDADIEVVRNGDGSRRWKYGYEYVIRYFHGTSPEVRVSWCTAIPPLVRRSETPTGSCLHGEPSFATLQPEPLCVADASIEMVRREAGDATMTSCSLNDVTGGQHLYPSSSCDLRIADGAFIDVASDFATFQAVDVAPRGSLVVTARATSAGALSLHNTGLLRFSRGNNVSIVGNWRWMGGTVEGAAVVTALSGVNCSSFSTILSESRLIVKGESRWQSSTLRLNRGASIEIEDTAVSLFNFSVVSANDESWLDVGSGAILNAASSTIAVPLHNRGSVACENATVYKGGGGEGSWQGSILIAGGQLNLEAARSISGSLKVGTDGQLFHRDDTSVPLVIAKGGHVTIRGTRVRLEESVFVENGGKLSFTAPAANVSMTSTVDLFGSMQFPTYETDAVVRRFHTHDGPRNQQRSVVNVRGMFTFVSGHISGNVDLHLRADSFLSGQPIVSDAAFLINHANSVLNNSLRLLAYRGGYFENRATSFDEAKSASEESVRVLRLPDPGATWWPRENIDELGQIEFEDNMLRDGRKVELKGDDSLFIPR